MSQARTVEATKPALGRYQPYPEYKDSGVEWLGEIPADWQVRRLKSLATVNPESLREDTLPEFEMTYVDIGSVDSRGQLTERESLAFWAAPSRARRLVRDGDVVVSTDVIQRLTELRTALISSAVTGKIDVREEAG